MQMSCVWGRVVGGGYVGCVCGGVCVCVRSFLFPNWVADRIRLRSWIEFWVYNSLQIFLYLSQALYIINPIGLSARPLKERFGTRLCFMLFGFISSIGLIICACATNEFVLLLGVVLTGKHPFPHCLIFPFFTESSSSSFQRATNVIKLKLSSYFHNILDLK